MRKIALILVVLMMLSLCGCSITNFFHKDPIFQVENLPKELSSRRLTNDITCTIRIDDVKFSYQESFGMHELTITLYGMVIYKNTNSYISLDSFTYKICNSQGYIEEKGTFYLNGFDQGDKFKQEVTVYFEADPDETYTIELCESI